MRIELAIKPEGNAIAIEIICYLCNCVCFRSLFTTLCNRVCFRSPMVSRNTPWL